ncbi:DNA repair protein RecO [Hufsiella ginkgonis]|uniref:DNA repair protein RecO n=1 Tax=Hufsiella ginkgonis TaxID=2695274 RepID=A0A7K1Y4P4_9SPHI|nr:DNA repair protein RecO [Hufsiella ginkgonis]MXV17827.1 DNA repair protein RecO [Hufsiella ginkgonis]
MLHKTRGIVFKTTDYAESSVVVQVFTEKFGLQSYLINGVKKPKAKIKQQFLQPLYLLDMVVYHKPSGNIQRAAEIRHSPIFHSIPYNLVKSSVVLFLNEVLYRSIKQQTADEVLFNYVFHAIELLDRLETGVVYFHLVFLMRLTQFLGFFPGKPVSGGPSMYFDLRHAEYTHHPPAHPLSLHPPYTASWDILASTNFETIQDLYIPLADRKYLLEKLLGYYRLHIEGFGEVRSLAVLEEIW